MYLPEWMMKSLKLKTKSKVHLRTVNPGLIPNGTLCKLQPHSSDFAELASIIDVRTMLEEAFRLYSTLNKGNTINVLMAGKSFFIDIVETEPENSISLVGNLDLEVDFAPPLDTLDADGNPLREEGAYTTKTPVATANPAADGAGKFFKQT